MKIELKRVNNLPETINCFSSRYVNKKSMKSSLEKNNKLTRSNYFLQDWSPDVNFSQYSANEASVYFGISIRAVRARRGAARRSAMQDAYKNKSIVALSPRRVSF